MKPIVGCQVPKVFGPELATTVMQARRRNRTDSPVLSNAKQTLHSESIMFGHLAPTDFAVFKPLHQDGADINGIELEDTESNFGWQLKKMRHWLGHVDGGIARTSNNGVYHRVDELNPRCDRSNGDVHSCCVLRAVDLKII